ncbi:MAG: hypothetical protein R2713_07125 [Ilumatobacteraceae bacterium]
MIARLWLPNQRWRSRKVGGARASDWVVAAVGDRGGCRQRRY